MAGGEFEGRTAVVTGGARGLGYAMARAIADEGADVVLLDRLDTVAESAERLAAETGARTGAASCDVTDPASIAAALDTATERFSTPTLLVNAAGIALNEPALTMTPDQWRSVIEINLTGTFLVDQAFARRVVDAGIGQRPDGGSGAAIVNVASMSGTWVNVPQPQAGYNTSKAGVAMLTKSLAIEWLPLGIRVNAISPGYFASEMTKAVSSTDPDMYAEWMRRTPAGRMGEPDELGPLVVYLLSEKSAFVHGQSIVIDGGYGLV